jgi:hypothetical protein
MEMRKELKKMSDDDRGPKNFAKLLNTEILEKYENAKQSISEKTARKWMIYLGYEAIKAKKGYYTDSHNRRDVTAYRDNNFLPKMADYVSRVVEYDGPNMDVELWPLALQHRNRLIPITRDESTFYANDRKRFFWLEKGIK